MEPVLAADGHTYNAWIMQPWLEAHDDSPCSGSPLNNKTLMPNMVIRCLAYQHMFVLDPI